MTKRPGTFAAAGAAVFAAAISLAAFPPRAGQLGPPGAEPGIEKLAVADGTLLFREKSSAARPTAVVGGEAVFAPRDARAPEVLSLLPFINGEASVVVTRRPADKKLVAYMRDSKRNTFEALYERVDDPGWTMEALDWSLANQVFLYEHQISGAGRWLGKTTAVTVFPRATVDLTARHGVRGIPSVDSAGNRVVFLVGPVDTLGQPYHLELLDLQTGAKRTIYERFGTRVIVSNGEPTMTATRPRWAREDRAVVFADTDHSVDGPPTVIQVPVADGAGPRIERKLDAPGQALDLLLGPTGSVCVLMRRTADGRYLVVALDMASGRLRELLSRERPIELLAVVP